MESKKTIIKKKKIIIMLCITAIILLLAIGLIVGTLIYNLNKEDDKMQIGNVNMSSLEEEYGEEEDILQVELEENEGQSEEQEEGEKPEEPKENNSMQQKPKVVNAPYYIKVNNQANVVTVYKKDSHGKYTVPIKAMLCSIGNATPTSGTYTISDKYTWRLLEGNVYGQYACRIVGSILFHSVPYEQKDKSTLEWWEYDKLGTKASAGCVRLTVEDAKWIYNNCIPGTKVEFYSESAPGPLGKPTAKKISSDEEVRRWDPTDPDGNNPWPEYLKKKKEEEDKNQENVNNSVKNELNTNTVTNNTTNTNVNNVQNNIVNNKPVNGTSQNAVTNTANNTVNNTNLTK